MKFILGILVFIITTIVLIVLIVSLFRSLSSTSSPSNLPITSSYNLTDSSAADAVVRYTVSGPIVADEKYQSVRITIDKSSRKVEVLKGYKGVVDKTQAYPNSTESYSAFIQALRAARFTDKRDSAADIRTTCVTGNRYTFELTSSSVKKVDSWTTACSGRSGTFAGDISGVAQLFRAQIPNYSEVTSGASVY
jgi:hypothetical protein